MRLYHFSLSSASYRVRIALNLKGLPYDYVPVNLDQIDRLFGAQEEVSQATLASVGLLGDVTEPVVVLARGEVTKPLTVKVQRISATAKQKIEAAGGTVEVLPFTVDKRRPRS